MTKPSDNIELKELDVDRDLDSLFSMMLSSDQYLFSTIISINSKEEFEEWLRSQIRNFFHEFKVIFFEGKAVGFLYAYEFTLKDLHCKLCMDICDTLRGIGVGGIAAIMYLDYLFDTYPLRKVYSTVYEYNKQSLLSNIRAGFCEEGVLKEYRYYNGKYYDMHFFSITRERFATNLKKIARR